MSFSKGSYRNPKGEYGAFTKGSAKKPPISNDYILKYEQEKRGSTPENGLGKRVQEV